MGLASTWRRYCRAITDGGPERAPWRANDLAMTCLGNIMERMDRAQMNDFFF